MSAFRDARSADMPEELSARVCIIGAGAAGITLARTLGQKMDGIVLVESGDFDIDGSTQALTTGKQLGLRYYNLVSCRLRYFGGTTNHWSGFCRDNDDLDYAGRPEIGLPGWPVDREELAEYISDAGDSLGIADPYQTPEALLDQKSLDQDLLAERHSDILKTKIFQYAARKRLGPVFRSELEATLGVQPVFNLNLTHIQLSPSGDHVEHVDCATLDGRKIRIKAKRFVLCCHAIENARQLLMSNDVAGNGIGNTHDHVGRYFMDHIHIFASRMVPTPAFPKVYDYLYASQHGMNANLSFTDAFTKEAGILQYYCRFNPVYVSDETKRAMRGVQNGFLEPGDLQFLRDVGRVAVDVMGAAKMALAQTRRAYPLPDYYALEHRLEQAPNPDSRVVLSDRKDALDCPIADLDWRVTDLDVSSFRKGQEILAREMAALGYGRVEEETIDRALVESRVAGHYHQIGTTRMSERPEDGVVTPDCRVHGVDNLYVQGSSIFPTAGYSGPTMLIIAFAMRLADHLAQLET